TKAFDAPTNARLAAAILTSHPPRVSELKAGTPAFVDYIVGRCLAKDPDKRWQTARDLLAELERSRAGIRASSVASQPEGRQAARDPVDGGRWKAKLRWLAAAVLLAVGVAAFGYGLRGRSSPPLATGRRPSGAVLPFIPLGRETQDDDYIALGLAEALIRDA